MSLSEFRKEILKVDKPRKTTINNSYGVYDAYKYYRKNKPKDPKYILSESQYFAIVRQINLLLAQELLDQKDIVFPYSMGRLEVRKSTPKVYIEDGKVKSTYPIDWDGTLKLWYEDQESRENKTIIKKKEKEVFRIMYNKSKAFYTNKNYFAFKVNRALKLALRDVIRQGNFDAFNSR
jgi:hypothetical protein